MFKYNQRRYLGNKYKLNNFIAESIKDSGIKYETFIDLFAGTGSVGFSQIEQGKKVIFNDFLFSNYSIYEAFAGKARFSMSKLEKIISKWNSLHILDENYFSEKFGNKYFEKSDSKKLGFCRDELESLLKNKTINKREYFILLASLMYSMDRIAETVGHYDAYRDGAATKSRLKIELIQPMEIPAQKILNADANQIAGELDGDVVYIDPPYNSRQYGDAYHVLENFAKWEKPETFGKASKMDRHDIKSEYSTKNAIVAFETLINSLKTKYIIISYNDTGLFASGRSAAKMTDEDIVAILKRRGKVKVYKQEYLAFNTGKTERKKVYERLFICEVSSKPIYLQNIKSPLNYTGGKFNVIDLLKSNFPNKINKFYDVFCGALNVGVNSESSKVYATETLSELVDVINYIKSTTTTDLIGEVEKVINKFNLSNSAKYSYAHYSTTSSNGLAEFNKHQYIKLREEYNRTKNIRLLLVLIIYGFNNLIRFNGKGEFNTPVGKRDFNNKVRANLIAFSERLKDIVIEISNKSYDSLNINSLGKDDFVFMDPPYWITKAVYNYGKWTENDEIKLCNFIRALHKKGVKFMLTNVIKTNARTNYHLEKLISDLELNVVTTKNNFSNSSYNKNRNEKSIEIVVKNY